jgi:single-stranded-DNA-specific exonuclease
MTTPVTGTPDRNPSTPDRTAPRWQTKPQPDEAPQREAVESLTSLLGITPFLASLLVQRGIHSFDEARTFFRPELAHLHDPFLMRDMDRAVARLDRAVRQAEKILVYGDYDVDGTTSVALVYGFLRQTYLHLDYYIPDRYAEGYGVSRTGIQWAADNGFSLIVCLDCGVKSVGLVAEAKALGVDFIICDHHRPGDVLPDAAAVLDPKRDDCTYPFDELTGCGVGFKLLQAYCLFNNLPTDPLLGWLDLVAVSIAADIVPMVGENRILTHYGLRVLNQQPRPGLHALLQAAGVWTLDPALARKEVTVENIVFAISPRINAAGRIQHAREAVKLMLAANADEAEGFAEIVNAYNSQRKLVDSGITEQALGMIRDSDTAHTAQSTVLFDPGWHKGVVGIVASRCIEKFHRPTVILTASHDKASGSARSVPGFDLYGAIEECADLLLQFGGHTHAAGLTLEISNVPLFRQRFEQAVAAKIKPQSLEPVIDIDLPLDFSAVDGKFFRVMKQMAPFGPGNLSPVFRTDDVYLVGGPTVMKEKHLKIFVRQGPAPFGRTGPSFTAVGWNMAHLAPLLPTNAPFAICYQIEENHFNGERSLQFMLKDVKVGQVRKSVSE